MSRLLPADLNEILDQCILRLQAGEILESILADYPAMTADLRPALETVTAIWSVRGSDTVPVAAMMRSRAGLINATHRLNTVPRPSIWRVRWILFSGFLSRTRPVLVPMAGIILIASLLFTGLASAQALPGEPFYPVKIAAEQIRLSLAGSPSDRLKQEETYDLRRKEEVEALITQNREEEVYITGFLTQADTLEWQIDEIKISIPAEMIPDAQQLKDHYVYLHADLLPHGEMVAEWFEPRVYLITGRISTLEPQRVLVGDVWLQLDQSSQVPQLLQMGQTVRASVTRIQGDVLVALKIEVIGQAPTPTATMIEPSETVEPGETFQPSGGEEHNPTVQPDASDPEKTKQEDDDDQDKPDENKEPTSTANDDDNKDEKPTATPENNHRQTRTPEPTRRKNH
jgi:hypothetical protein